MNSHMINKCQLSKKMLRLEIDLGLQTQCSTISANWAELYQVYFALITLFLIKSGQPCRQVTTGKLLYKLKYFQLSAKIPRPTALSTFGIFFKHLEIFQFVFVVSLQAKVTPKYSVTLDHRRKIVSFFVFVFNFNTVIILYPFCNENCFFNTAMCNNMFIERHRIPTVL